MDRDLCKRPKVSFIPIFSLFFWFSHMIFSDVYFTRIAASNTASDDVTN